MMENEKLLINRCINRAVIGSMDCISLSSDMNYFTESVVTALESTGYSIIEHINRSPYEGEVTQRTYIFTQKCWKEL
jgi:hypothetical protein